MQATLEIQEERTISREMTESKASTTVACMIIKKTMETPNPTKEDSSMDELSSIKSWTSSSSSFSSGTETCFLCPSCKRKMFESRSETSSEDDEYESNNTYDISDADSFDVSDTTNGSGYISMEGSSSIDDSQNSYEESSDTSCYYCDRSASLSSDMDDFYSESMSGDDSNLTPSLERECCFKEVGFLEIEE